MIDLCSTETRVVKCSDPNGVCDPNIRPVSERNCELPPDIECGKWIFGQWSQCNISCGEAYRTRSVECQGGNICNTLLKPHDTEFCYSNPPCVESISDNQNDTIIADVIISLNKNIPKRKHARSVLENKTEEESDYFILNDFNSINYFGPNENVSNETIIDENSILFEKEYFIDDDFDTILSNNSIDYEWQVGSFSVVSFFI